MDQRARRVQMLHPTPKESPARDRRRQPGSGGPSPFFPLLAV